MKDRFAERARRVLDLAREQADSVSHRYRGPEHVVLGLLREGTSPAAQVLRDQGLELEAARGELDRLGGRGVVAARRPSDVGGSHECRAHRSRVRRC